MRTIVFAYHNIGCEGIKALLRNEFDIAAVVTHPNDPAEKIWFDSVAELTVEKKISVYAPVDINHPLWVDKIRSLKPDIMFSFYYRHVLSSKILAVPPKGALNLHGSLLPAYRGRCPVNWVLINGEKETGVTLHYMTSAPDAGDIVAQRKIGITPEDTALTLYKKMVPVTTKLLNETLPQLKTGTAPRNPQDSLQASYYGGRRPEDGKINWNQSAQAVLNLVRAVTKPYPGAFSYAGNRKVLFWRVTGVTCPQKDASPGTVLSTSPLIIACGSGAVQVENGQLKSGVPVTGHQLADELSIAEGMTFGPSVSVELEKKRKKNVLILGVNGFIGNALTERLLESGRYEVHGMDIQSNSITRFIGKPDFTFHEGDIAIHREWIEYHIKKCDIIIPLVAIATPVEYTRNPLTVFELDFEENLRIVRYCAKYHRRLIFPSTSEVYGMCGDTTFDEESSNLILGPISKQRWIYSCSKQLLDRVIYAYGQKKGLKFTLFRPFNWIGPRLDSLSSARIGSSRAITQLILNLVEGTPIKLVDGGEQKRCFTDISDGVDCLYKIIENRGGRCDGQIINIGSPENEVSIRKLAEMLADEFDRHSLRAFFPPFAGMREVESSLFYGRGYQDVQHRKPRIENARRLLSWTPVVPLEKSIEETLDFFLRQSLREAAQQPKSKAPSIFEPLQERAFNGTRP